MQGLTLKSTITLVIFGITFLGSSALAAEKGNIEERVKEQAKNQYSCISCHSQLEGEYKKPVEEWSKSIHKKNGNMCDGCHGGNPKATEAEDSMDPEKGFVGAPKKPQDIPDFCGKCHIGVVKNYKNSIHYYALQEGEGPSCVTCHNSHNVKKASINLINPKRCSKCHEYEQAQKIKKSFITADLKIQNINKELKDLEEHGINVEDMKNTVFSVRNSLHQMTHVLDVKKIMAANKKAMDKLEKIDQNVEKFWSIYKKRQMVGAVVGGFCLFVIIILSIYLKMLPHRVEDDKIVSG